MTQLFTPLNIVIFGLWSVTAILDYIEFCYIWQLKEYRIDRMRDFFSTKQGQQYWLHSFLLVRVFLVLFISFWPINEIPTLKLIVLAWFTLDLLYHVGKLISHKIRYPQPTPKAILIIAAAFGFEFVLAFLSRDWNLVFFFLIARFFVISAIVLLANQATHAAKEWIIWRATQKMARYPKLKVLGITGSYGKSSVKEYVSQILAEKYRVIKTPGNINTDIGVANFILCSDFGNKDIFVVEMGAYRIGEIKKICDIVKPEIGVLTAIIEQHLSLFGSIQNIQQAKYELLRSIPDNGLVITYADNPYCTELLSELICANRQTFGDEIKNFPDYAISGISSNQRGVGWQVDHNGENIVFTTPLLGAHQPFNVVPAIMAARHLGVGWIEIQHAVSHLRPGQKSLTVYQYGEATIIDDSYNSNPKGFKAALDILTTFPSSYRRIVITRGMLELAEKTRDYHERIGEEIAFSADELVIITPDFVDDFMVGVKAIKAKYHLDVKTIFSPTELLAYVKAKCHEPAVILLENRIPAEVYNEIKGSI